MEDDSPKRQVLVSAVLLSSSKIATYFFLLLLGNLFLIEEYGKAAFAYSIFSLIMLPVTIGVPGILVPWMINKKDYQTIFWVLASFTILITSTAVFLSSYWPIFLPFSIAIPFLFLKEFGNSFLRAEKKFGIVQFSYTLSAVVTMLSIYFLARYSSIGITTSYVMGFVASSVFIIFLTTQHFRKMAFRIKAASIFSYFRKGAITTILSVSLLFLFWVDTLILGLLSTYENVAKYNIAGPLSNVLTIIPLTLSAFLLTRSAEEKDSRYSEGMFHRTMRLSFSGSLIAGIALNALIVFLLKFFFPQYLGIQQYVMILSIGILLFGGYHLISTYLSGKLEPKKALFPILIAVLVNLGLDILLIPYFGLYGITIATTTAHLVAFVLLARKVNLPLRFMWAIPLSLSLPAAYFLGIYGLILILPAIYLLFWTGLIEKGDLKVVYDITCSLLRRG